MWWFTASKWCYIRSCWPYFRHLGGFIQSISLVGLRTSSNWIMSSEFSPNEEIYYKMDHFLEGMEKEMKFLTKIRFIKCVLPKLTVFEKKIWVHIAKILINKVYNFFFKGICGRLLPVLVWYLPPVAGRYLNDRPADVYALSFNWRLYITSYLDFALLKISRVWRASISNKDLNIEPIPFLFSDSTANVFPEFIFGCLCNKNANTPAHKGISFSRR